MASICFCSKSSNRNAKLAGAVQFLRNGVVFVPATDEWMLWDKNLCFIHAHLEIIGHLNPVLVVKGFPEEVEVTYWLESGIAMYQMF